MVDYSKYNEFYDDLDFLLNTGLRGGATNPNVAALNGGTIALVTDGTTDNQPTIQSALGGSNPTPVAVQLGGTGTVALKSPLIIGQGQFLRGSGPNFKQGGASGGITPGIVFVPGTSWSNAIPLWAQTLYGLPATLDALVIFAGVSSGGNFYCSGGAEAITVDAGAGSGPISYAVALAGSDTTHRSVLYRRGSVCTVLDYNAQAPRANFETSMIEGSTKFALDVESVDWKLDGGRLVNGAVKFNGQGDLVANVHLTGGLAADPDGVMTVGYNTKVQARMGMVGCQFDTVPVGANGTPSTSVLLVENNTDNAGDAASYVACRFHENNSGYYGQPIIKRYPATVNANAPVLVSACQASAVPNSAFNAICDFTLTGDEFDISIIDAALQTNTTTTASGTLSGITTLPLAAIRTDFNVNADGKGHGIGSAYTSQGNWATFTYTGVSGSSLTGVAFTTHTTDTIASGAVITYTCASLAFCFPGGSLPGKCNVLLSTSGVLLTNDLSGVAAGLDYSGGNGAFNYAILSHAFSLYKTVLVPPAPASSNGIVGLSQTLNLGTGQRLVAHGGLTSAQGVNAGGAVIIAPATDGFTATNGATITCTGQYSGVRGLTVQAQDQAGGHIQLYALSYNASDVTLDGCDFVGGSLWCLFDLSTVSALSNRFHLHLCNAWHVGSGGAWSHNSFDAIATNPRLSGTKSLGVNVDGMMVVGGHIAGGNPNLIIAGSGVQYIGTYFDGSSAASTFITLSSTGTAKAVQFADCRFIPGGLSNTVDLFTVTGACLLLVEGGEVIWGAGGGSNKWGAMCNGAGLASSTVRFRPSYINGNACVTNSLTAYFPTTTPSDYDFYVDNASTFTGLHNVAIDHVGTSGQILRSNGTVQAWTTQSQYFSGNGTFTIPAGATLLRLSGSGGGGQGGGGGGATGTTLQAGGGAGGAGMAAEQIVPVGAATSLTVAVGAGGSAAGGGGTAGGGAGTAGSNGASTTFTGTGISVTFVGGSGGNASLGNSTASALGGPYGQGIDNSTNLNGAPCTGGGSAGRGGDPLGPAGGGGGGGGAATATNGGSGGGAGTLGAGGAKGTSGGSGTAAGTAGTAATANTGGGGGGGGGGAAGTGAGGAGGNGGSGWALVEVIG